jgi:phosphate uptake regulator
MIRKAIQLANNTLVVSLPAKWVQQNSIAKGADLDIDVKDTSLIVRKGAIKGDEVRKVNLDISGMPASLVWSYLNATYRAGFNEIDVFFSDQTVKDIKTGGSKKTIDLISRITDKLIGMEIIRQSKNSCTLKEITQLRGDEFSNVIHRIFLSLLTVSKDIIDAAKTSDKETLVNIYDYSEININKLSDYCMRILNTNGLGDFRDTDANYLVTFLLEEVGDSYAEIARLLSVGKFSQDLVPVMEKANSILSLSHKFFLNPKREYYIEFHNSRQVMKSEIDSLLAKKKVNFAVLFSLKMASDKLMELNNAKLTGLGGF